MMRLVMTATVMCALTGCGGSDVSARLKALEQRVDELAEQTLIHNRDIAAHHTVITRMQRDDINHIERENEAIRERIRKLDQ